MLGYITLIFCCQLAGELIVVASGLPLPGPVIGMMILFGFLAFVGSIPRDLAATGDALLANLSLMFVPAGVGVMLHGALLGRDWLPISIALIVSTSLAVVVTGVLMAKLSPTGNVPSPPPAEKDRA
mgnify:CR=1 FL=1